MPKNITPRWFNRKVETQKELNRIRAFAVRRIAHVLRDEVVGATLAVAQEGKEKTQT